MALVLAKIGGFLTRDEPAENLIEEGVCGRMTEGDVGGRRDAFLHRGGSPEDPGKPGLRYRVSPDIMANRVADLIVLVHLQTDKIFSLNRTASRFWELLSAGHSPGEIRQQLMEEFDVAESDVTVEIDELLASLSSEGFITSAE
ncbi:MAG: PqqD family protein [Candidatus Methylomirabilis sp.]